MKKIKIIIVLFLVMPLKIIALGDAAILMEEDTKRVLVSKNIHKKKLIASTTKIMTGILAVESGKLNDIVTVNNKILDSYGSNIYLKVGEKIKLIDLVYGLMMQSGNDASLMIADYLGGYDNFVNEMNKKASQINMKNTIFTNPHGLDEKTENYSTAYDMALLMRYAINNKTLKKIMGCKKHQVVTNEKTYLWHNKNRLLYTYKYTTGGKTGFTKKARRTLVTSASNNNLNLIAVTLNDSNDFINHKKLYEYGFNNYKMVKVFDKRLLNNKKYYAEDDYYYPLSNKELKNIIIKYKVGNNNTSYVHQRIGYANIYFKSNLIHKEPLFKK